MFFEFRLQVIFVVIAASDWLYASIELRMNEDFLRFKNPS